MTESLSNSTTCRDVSTGVCSEYSVSVLVLVLVLVFVFVSIDMCLGMVWLTFISIHSALLQTSGIAKKTML